MELKEVLVVSDQVLIPLAWLTTKSDLPGDGSNSNTIYIKKCFFFKHINYF